MRALAFALMASPAAAWEFTPSPICTLSHSTADASVTVTYHAAIPEYTISVTRTTPWPDAPGFAIAFLGPMPLTIQTDRHELSEDGLTLTVRDSGFGNVLNGLEFNSEAVATSGDAGAILPLDGIGPPMQAFRACPEVTLS
jgi:hypothetical protein